jgi:ATP-binding protein involved in chromosome partitioning
MDINNIKTSLKAILKDGILSDIIYNNDKLTILINSDLLSVDEAFFNKYRILQYLQEALNIEKSKIQIIFTGKDAKEDLSNEPKVPPNMNGMFTKIDGVNKVIVVASGKGGVGKSTISVAIAEKLKNDGRKVGICDLDIYGPSIPIIMGVSDQEIEFEDGKILPINVNGIQMMSIGMMLDYSTPTIWRGAMLTKAVNKLTRSVKWDSLDYLIIDTPPGTGDVHLTLCQQHPIDILYCVTTQDELSIKITNKSIEMFKKLGISPSMTFINMFNENKKDDSFVLHNVQKIPYINDVKDIASIISLL